MYMSENVSVCTGFLTTFVKNRTRSRVFTASVNAVENLTSDIIPILKCFVRKTSMPKGFVQNILFRVIHFTNTFPKIQITLQKRAIILTSAAVFFLYIKPCKCIDCFYCMIHETLTILRSEKKKCNGSVSTAEWLMETCHKLIWIGLNILTFSRFLVTLHYLDISNLNPTEYLSRHCVTSNSNVLLTHHSLFIDSRLTHHMKWDQIKM